LAIVQEKYCVFLKDLEPHLVSTLHVLAVGYAYEEMFLPLMEYRNLQKWLFKPCV
jgi:hypothetical protein